MTVHSPVCVLYLNAFPRSATFRAHQTRFRTFSQRLFLYIYRPYCLYSDLSSGFPAGQRSGLLTFAPRKNLPCGSNLTLHSYHVTALRIIPGVSGKCKSIFQKTFQNLLQLSLRPSCNGIRPFQALRARPDASGRSVFVRSAQGMRRPG